MTWTPLGASTRVLSIEVSSIPRLNSVPSINMVWARTNVPTFCLYHLYTVGTLPIWIVCQASFHQKLWSVYVYIHHFPSPASQHEPVGGRSVWPQEGPSCPRNLWELCLHSVLEGSQGILQDPQLWLSLHPTHRYGCDRPDLHTSLSLSKHKG